MHFLRHVKARAGARARGCPVTNGGDVIRVDFCLHCRLNEMSPDSCWLKGTWPLTFAEMIFEYRAKYIGKEFSYRKCGYYYGAYKYDQMRLQRLQERWNYRRRSFSLVLQFSMGDRSRYLALRGEQTQWEAPLNSIPENNLKSVEIYPEVDAPPPSHGDAQDTLHLKRVLSCRGTTPAVGAGNEDCEIPESRDWWSVVLVAMAALWKVVSVVVLGTLVTIGILVPVQGSTCMTPDSARGTCRKVHDCDALRGLVDSAFRTKRPQVVSLLRQYVSSCGFDRQNLTVCCPERRKALSRGAPGGPGEAEGFGAP
ncbi:uncharacterized protein LOC119578484 [Penaeus monodon]|uniref:uncharacterized protein LOC119578484 n=1 Tax=Penaeus monodon TaxID=6687 RepID=UPI0018A6DC46|nr:uncharacterized protein LOC119578484 [Penaeus monodon]